MTFKVVYGPDNQALACGPDDDNFQPNVPEGGRIEISATAVPIWIPPQPEQEVENLLRSIGWSRGELWAFLVGCQALQVATASAESRTLVDVEAEMFTRNKAYRLAKQAEAMCVAFERPAP